MSARSLNKVMLIGNLTRDPELRYTPSGTAVCTIGLATNRTWTTENGEKKEETEFHRVIAWNKLAELCSQLLIKGRKIYVEGRLRTNSWQGQDGNQRNITEIVIEDMILLDSRRPGAVGEEAGAGAPQPNVAMSASQRTSTVSATPNAASASDDKTSQVTPTDTTANEDVNPDDIPF